MKKIGLITFMILACSAPVLACVGKILTIGSLDGAEDKLFSHMLAVMINERTGTTVNVELFATHRDLYDAVEKGRVTIFAENPTRALRFLGKSPIGNEDAAHATVKEELKNRFNLVSLGTFGKPTSCGHESCIYIPVVAAGILSDYPALPRVINKLTGIAEDRDFPGLLSAMETGGKPNRLSRDFLKKKRYI
jgi:osmoprotectant transport system substrate-binding protein